MNELMLHCGASRMERYELANIYTPAATVSWHPVSRCETAVKKPGRFSRSGFFLLFCLPGVCTER